MSFVSRRWFQTLISGLVALFLIERVLVNTQNINFVPSVILLGAFLVPVTFVIYLYERLPDWDVPLSPLVICFLWGGVLGTVIAGTLEYDAARSLGFLPKLGVGLIEESSKLVVPLIFYFLGRYRSPGTLSFRIGRDNTRRLHGHGFRSPRDDGLRFCHLT